MDPKKNALYGARVFTSDISLVDGVVQKVLVPQYLLEANAPLAIGRKNHYIRIWSWDQGPLVSANFVVLLDGVDYDFSDRRLMVRRHFGTVFNDQGDALHLVHLTDTPRVFPEEIEISPEFKVETLTITQEITTDENVSEEEPKSKIDVFIEEVGKGSDGLELTYDGKHVSYGYSINGDKLYPIKGHRFKWKMRGGGHSSNFRGFDDLETKHKLKPLWFGANWEKRAMEISFYREDW